MTQDFSGFGLAPKLLQSLARMQFLTPTPIQAEAIPVALAGKDILASAQTGTGKTAAFGIPLIAKLMESPDSAALILTPTRELAAQVLTTLQQLIPVQTVKTALLIGGEVMPKQFKQLRMNPKLVVGTPGRVNDHLQRGTLKLESTNFLVLDETDRMLDMGFTAQLETIVRRLPKERQTMMFSATLAESIVRLSNKYLTNPVRIAVGSTSTPAAKIEQEMIHTTEVEKYDQLVQQLEKRNGSVIIFVKTKHRADRLADKLNRASLKADAIHGDLRQNKRDRVISSFRDQKFRILVATDIAARGLDIPHIEHVINYDLPQSPEDYIHRIGRTARAGAEGMALSLLTPEDGAKWRAVQRLIQGKEYTPDQSAPKSKSGKSRGFKGRNFKDRNFKGRDFKDRDFKGRNSEDRNFKDRNFKDRGFKKRGDSQDGESKERNFKDRNFKDRNFKDRDFKGGESKPRHFKDRDFKAGQPKERNFWDKKKQSGGDDNRGNFSKRRDNGKRDGDFARKDGKPGGFKKSGSKPGGFKSGGFKSGGFKSGGGSKKRFSNGDRPRGQKPSRSQGYSSRS